MSGHHPGSRSRRGGFGAELIDEATGPADVSAALPRSRGNDGRGGESLSKATSALLRAARRSMRAPGIGVPRWLLLPAVLGVLFVAGPLVALTGSVDWSHFLDLITSASARDALELSVRTAGCATLLCVVLGVPMAVVLARGRYRALVIVRAMVLLPLVLPPVVSGLALLALFGRYGLVGRELDAMGVEIAFSTTAVVLAQAFVALPFLVLTLEAALRTAGDRYERVAATLGAGPAVVWLRVTLPLLRPALISGSVLACARALGEFGATLTFAGSLQGRTRTLPLEIYLQRETDPDAAVALSLLLIAVAVVIVLFAYRRGVVHSG